MGEFRVEKRRVRAALTLALGVSVEGHFFVCDSVPTHAGPERVGDLLNSTAGFFPFHVVERGSDSSRIALYNRAHVLLVRLAEPEIEAELDPTFTLARRKSVSMLLSNGERVAGDLRMILPFENARLSDYARGKDQFHYVELASSILLVNFAQVIELLPITE